MASPSTSLSTLRPELGSLMEFDLEKNRQGFIGYRILPIIQVELASGPFGRIPTEQLCKVDDVNRMSTGGYNRGDMTFTDDSYATKEYGFEMPIDRRNARLYKRYFDAEVAAAKKALNTVLTKAELRVASAVFNTSTWTGAALTTPAIAPWSNPVTAKPITDVRAAAQKVRDNCGRYATTLTINRKVFRWLQDCEQIIERIESQGAGSATKPSDITKEMLARVFDIDEVIVADSSYDYKAQGQATVFTDVWSAAYAMVSIIAKDGDGIETPCVGRTFHWDADGSTPGGTIESYYEEQVRGDVVRVRHETHEKIIYPETGHLLTGIDA